MYESRFGKNCNRVGENLEGRRKYTYSEARITVNLLQFEGGVMEQELHVEATSLSTCFLKNQSERTLSG